MFRFIVRTFKAIDNFLTDCEDYVESRVWNGKFIYDLKFFSDSKIDDIKEESHRIANSVQSSDAYTSTIAFVRKFGKLLMQFQIVEDIVLLIVEGLKLYFKYFAHYLFVVVIGLVTTVILLTSFKYAPLLFLILFLPLLYGNHLLLTGFFTFTDKKEEGVHFTSTLGLNTLIFLLQVTITVTFGLVFLGFAFILSYFFGIINIEWSSSFLYWLPVVMVGLLIAVILYLVQVGLTIAYPYVLLDKQTGTQVFSRSLNIIHIDPRHSLIFYLLLTFFAVIFVGAASTTNYEGGFAVGILFINQAFLLLGFLLRKKYFKNFTDEQIPSIERLYFFCKPAIASGIVAYMLSAALFLQLHPDIMILLEQQRPSIAANYEYARYTNANAKYTIDYPRPWSVYRWDDHSTTIYTNVTGTDIGGIKVNINVMPMNDSNYLMLYEANPGLIQYDTGTRNVTTKITNLTIQGRNAVKYTYTKTDTKQTEFQVHYLIRNNDQVYDIAFVTVSKKIETAYMAIFDKMIDSFRIVP